MHSLAQSWTPGKPGRYVEQLLLLFKRGRLGYHDSEGVLQLVRNGRTSSNTRGPSHGV